MRMKFGSLTGLKATMVFVRCSYVRTARKPVTTEPTCRDKIGSLILPKRGS